MEDWMLPFHMMGSNYFGDVAIPTIQSGGVKFNPTELNPPSDFLNAVYNIDKKGTGFLISISEIGLNGVLKRLGLLLTAAHVVLNLQTGKASSHTFECFLNGIRDNAHFLKEFTQDTIIEHKCTSTGSLYCLPGDIAILLIELDNSNPPAYLEPANPDRIVKGASCYVPGFPVAPDNPRYCIPSSAIHDAELKSEMRKIFCDFVGIVYSHGAIVEKNNEIVEISCSTTSGMSGSPIISEGKYLGVYVGGPALPGQRELIDSISKVREGNYCQALELLKSLKKFRNFYQGDVFFAFLGHNIELVKVFAKSEAGKPLKSRHKKILSHYENNPDDKIDDQEDFYSSCLNLLYKLVRKFKERDNYVANLGISYKNEVFRKVDDYVLKFQLAKNMDFSDLQELIRHLNK